MNRLDRGVLDTGRLIIGDLPKKFTGTVAGLVEVEKQSRYR
jgi:hypothetical protein